MPRRRKKPTVPDQPVPQAKKTSRRHARRLRQVSSGVATVSNSGSVTRSKKREVPNNKDGKNDVGLLDLPDEILDKILVQILDTPNSTRTLEARCLGNWEYIYQIALSNSRLYNVVQRLITNLEINSNDAVVSNEIRITSKSLRKIIIRGHSLSEYILKELNLNLNNNDFNYLHLENINLSSFSFQYNYQSLHTLILSFINLPDISSTLSSYHNLINLKCLKLHGLSNLTGSCLLNICKVSNHSLIHLSLRYLRHQSISDYYLLSILKWCPSLHTIDLEHLPYCSQQSISQFFAFFKQRIESLRLSDISLNQSELHQVISNNFNTLTNLSIIDTVSSPIITDIDKYINLLSTNSSNIRVIKLTNIQTLTDFHMLKLLGNENNKFKSISIRNSININDLTCYQINAKCNESLEYLDLRNCIINDKGLEYLSKDCHNLKHIFLGADNTSTNISIYDITYYGNIQLSNMGFHQLLQSCGHNLVEFFWESPRFIISNNDHSPVQFQSLGIQHLNAKDLANSFMSECDKQSLLKIEINWLRPSTHLTKQRALCDLAFFDLYNAFPRLSVYLDKHPL